MTVETGRGSWEAHPDAGPLQCTLFLAVFSRIPMLAMEPDVGRTEGGLWSVFRARGEMMGRSDAPPGGVEALWSTHEAELTTGTRGSRLGWAQVGIEAKADLVTVLPALLQCLEDALGRFGARDWIAMRLTASDVPPRSTPAAASLASWLAWFSASAGLAVETVVATADGPFRGRSEPEVIERLQDLDSPLFQVGPLVSVPDEHRVEVAAEAPVTASLVPSDRGITVRLPEWSPAAVAGLRSARIARSQRDTPSEIVPPLVYSPATGLRLLEGGVRGPGEAFACRYPSCARLRAGRTVP